MAQLDVMFTMDCEAIAQMSKEGGPVDWDICKRAMEGYCDTLLQKGLKPTLFIVPHTAQHAASVLLELQKAGAELGLHLHPQDYGYDDYLGGFNYEEQYSMLQEACDRWSNSLGQMPKSFRGGNFSANDHTFGVLYELGFRQGSLSVPGRNFTRVKSNWAGGMQQPYHTSRANRLIKGKMDFLEIPVTTDWESVMWGGLTKLELRIEMVDSRAHGFTVRKNIDRQLTGGIEDPYILAMTHNIFDYTNKSEFRRQVLDGVIEEIDTYAEKKELRRVGWTLEEYHKKVDTGRKQ